MHRSVFLSSAPRRIVSLVPSQTELLYDLGLKDEVIGITKFCVHPQEWFRKKERIGGTKNVNIKKIISLNPDLIIANKEENVKEQIEELAQHFSVWISDVNTLNDAYAMMQIIGEICDRREVAEELIKRIQLRFSQLPTTNYKPPTAYLIWKDPYMTVGSDTFIHDMLEWAGFRNVFADKTRYPVVTITDLQEVGCKIVLLSSEPYPFKQKHVDELAEQLPGAKIFLADGEMFSWYGSRLLQAPTYFQQLRMMVMQ